MNKTDKIHGLLSVLLIAAKVIISIAAAVGLAVSIVVLDFVVVVLLVPAPLLPFLCGVILLALVILIVQKTAVLRYLIGIQSIVRRSVAIAGTGLLLAGIGIFWKPVGALLLVGILPVVCAAVVLDKIIERLWLTGTVKKRWRRSAKVRAGSIAGISLVLFFLAFISVNIIFDAGQHRVRPEEMPIYKTIRNKISRMTTKERYITFLKFKPNSVSDDGVKQLTGLSYLRILNLSDNPDVTDVSVPFLLEIKTLNELYIRGTSITPDGEKKLAQGFGGSGGVYGR